MVEESPEGARSLPLQRAIALLTEALDLLDAYVDCPDASAHLDLALRRLRQLGSLDRLDR